MRMIILLLAKITKLSWFDNPALQGVVQDLFQLIPMSNNHMYVAL